MHFLKTDFDKVCFAVGPNLRWMSTNRMQWVDEDEQDEAGEDDYANNFGGGVGGEDPNAGGLGNIDFSKLGGMPGMGGMGAGGMPDLSALAGMGGMPGGPGDEGAEEEDVSLLVCT
jgi:hypothetical protein